MTTQPKLRFFVADQLSAKKTPVRALGKTRNGFLTTDEEKQLAEFCANIKDSGVHNFGSALGDVAPHLRMFAAMLEALGAVEMTNNGTACVRNSGRLARHVPEILRIYLENNYRLIDDWDRSNLIQEDQLNAVNFIHLLEMRRIELSVQSGTDPQPLANRPVAFGIFRAVDERGESCYLFEVNKDWRRLNFVGGKQEAVDQLDFDRTLKREISEEIGIPPNRVTLTRLNDQPIVGYGLSGNAGSLASYPCVLFGVTVTGKLELGQHHHWLTEKQIREEIAKEDGRIMVNPIYLNYLLEGSPTRLARCPLSTDQIVTPTTEKSPVLRINSRTADFPRNNQKLIVAVLTILTAAITLTVTLVVTVRAH